MKTFVTQEGSTPVFSTQIIDAAGDPVTSDSLDSLHLTLYDKASQQILNNRERQDVLNKNGITVDDEGALTWVLDEEDNVILNDALKEETHMALFEVRWAADLIPRVQYVEIKIIVRNLQLVPA